MEYKDKLIQELTNFLNYLEKEYEKQKILTIEDYQKDIIEKVIIENKNEINNFFQEAIEKNILNKKELIKHYNNFTKNNFEITFFSESITFYFNKDFYLFMYTLPICIEYICKKKTIDFLTINFNKNKDGFVLDTLEYELNYLQSKNSIFLNELLKIILVQNDTIFNFRNKSAHIKLKQLDCTRQNANILLLSFLIIIYLCK